jgi:hypothetical protein
LDCSKFWNKQIQSWFYYVDSEAFDRAKFYKRANSTRDLVKCKSIYHKVCVLDKICAICRKSFPGGFHKYWGVHAHDKCIRPLIKNEHHIPREVLEEIKKQTDFPRETRTGHAPPYHPNYKYRCFWMHRSALIIQYNIYRNRNM